MDPVLSRQNNQRRLDPVADEAYGFLAFKPEIVDERESSLEQWLGRQSVRLHFLGSGCPRVKAHQVIRSSFLSYH